MCIRENISRCQCVQTSHVTVITDYPFFSRVGSVINMETSNFYDHQLKLFILITDFPYTCTLIESGINSSEFKLLKQILSYKLVFRFSITKYNISYPLSYDLECSLLNYMFYATSVKCGFNTHNSRDMYGASGPAVAV